MAFVTERELYCLIFIEKLSPTEIAKKLNLSRQGLYGMAYRLFGEEDVKNQFTETKANKPSAIRSKEVFKKTEENKKNREEQMYYLSELYNASTSNDGKSYFYTVEEIAEMVGFTSVTTLMTQLSRYRERGFEHLFPKRSPMSGSFKSVA
jgi:AraC-like DNA-binding protein